MALGSSELHTHTPPWRAVAPLVAALVVAGCSPLSDNLVSSRDTIIGVEVALEPDPASIAAVSGPSDIALVRQFVRGRAMHGVAAAVASVLGTSRLETLELRAVGSQSGEWHGVPGTALIIDASPGLRRFEERIMEIMRGFAVDPETAESFIRTPDGAPMSAEVIADIYGFVPEASGVHYRPHLILRQPQGAPKPNAAQAMTFKARGVSIYQLGRLGAPERLLWTWTGGIGAQDP